MTQSQPPITGTTHPLPFDKLSPRDFERLCLWLVQREGYERAEHLGAAGSEQGRDIVAWREGALWAFQCKRVQSFGPKDALAEVEKVLALPGTECPAGLVFLVTCDVSANTRQQARERCEQAGLECDFWAGTELDEKAKRHPDIVEEFFQADQSRMTIVGDSNVVGDVSSVAGITQIEGDVTESTVVTAGRDVIINLTAQTTQQMLGDLLEPLRRLTISTLSEIPPEHRLSELLSFLPQEEIARLAKEVLEQSGADYHILFRNIVLDDDTDAAEHTRQGFTALAGSQPKLAMHHFERAIELERGRADAWLGLSWAQYESNLLQEALTSIVEAERLAPALVEKNKSVRASILIEYGHAHSTRNLVQEGIQIFEAILAEDETQAMAWYNLGNAYSALANYKQAVTCFKNAIDLQPDFPDVYVNLGVAYYHLDQHEEELSCYENALKINPDHPQALVSKGATLSIVYDKHDEAIVLYEQVLANAPDYCREWPKVWYNLGHACALAGKYKRAYEALSHFRKIDPTVPVEGLLAHVLSTLWRKEPDKYAVEAAESFTRYVAAQPDDRRARFELGEIFYWLQEYDQALEAYPVPDLSSETNATLLDHYGHCLSKSGQQEQSLPYFARAAELSSVYRHCYARQLLFLQRYAEALSNLVEMAEDYQDDPAYLCDLGICYANLEKEPAALVAFNQAIDQDEEYADAWYYLGLTCANRHEYRFALATLVYAGRLDDELAPRVVQIVEEIRATQQEFDQLFLRGLRSYLAGVGEEVDGNERAALRLLSYGDGYREQEEFEQAEAYYQQALSHCKNGAYPWLAAAITRRLAQIARDTGNLERATILYVDAFRLAVFAQDELLIAEIGSEAGNVLSTIGQHRRAIQLLEISLELELRAGRDILIAAIQHDLAVTYYQSGDLTRARGTYHQALASSEQCNYDFTRVGSWEGLGHVYRDMALYLLGVEFYQKALTFHQDHDDLASIGRVLNGMGVAYHWLGDYGAAVNTLSRSIQIKRELNDNAGLPDVYVNLGNIFTDLKLYNQARFYYALAQAQFAEARNALGFVDSKIAFGLSLEAEGALSEAIDLYRDTLATFAEINEALTAKLRFYLGQALWQNRQGEEAYQALHAAHQSAIALGWAGLAESCQRALALLETEQEQVEAEFQPVDSSPEDELDATAPYPRAYSVHKTLRTFKEGICSLDDFANEINQRFTYPDPIVRVQSMLLLKEALPFLEDRHDTWQRFSSLAEDPNALVRTVFCVYCTNHCRVLGKLDEGVSILLSLTHDEDADVRAMSLSGLAELYRTLSDEQRQRIEERFNQVADDEEEHVQLAAKRFREHFYT